MRPATALLLLVLAACGNRDGASARRTVVEGTPDALVVRFCEAMLAGDAEEALACTVQPAQETVASILRAGAALTRLQVRLTALLVERHGEDAAASFAARFPLHPVGDPSYYGSIAAMHLKAVDGDLLWLPPGMPEPCALVRRDGAWRLDLGGILGDAPLENLLDRLGAEAALRRRALEILTRSPDFDALCAELDED